MIVYRALDDPQKKDLDPDPDPNLKRIFDPITILILQRDLRSDHDPQKDPFNKNHRTIICVHLLEGDALWHGRRATSVHLQQPGSNSLRT